ncbi:hypothetical protein MKI84_03955 [Ancylobacter sp. A5.8]|uniref:hypothetical protein n=1 Tax=Ancylobacter gelatini TaxID=2919920 RepID=UPI001F4D66E6|nr:hypothetical protein [Ancylobacter gelatini]MCJ8142062.1 hypothetical protein [Ancylobacter gelatini]
MKRALPRAHLAARLSFILPFTLLALPAAAQTTGAPAPTNPWGSITVILLSPAGESPYEAAQRASDAAVAAQTEAAAIAAQAEAAATTQPADSEYMSDEDADAAMQGALVEAGEAPAPSLWNALLGSVGVTSGAAPAKLPERKSVAAPKSASVPTKLELKQGPASLAVSTNASASAPVSGALSTSAGGGSGEIKGRVGFEQDNLTIYSTGAVGAAASTGVPSLYDNLAVGSTYSMPLAPLGLGNEKLGASVEMNSTQTVTTGLELRSPLGSYERYISVQRSIAPDSDGSGLLKAGVLGKF